MNVLREGGRLWHFACNLPRGVPAGHGEFVSCLQIQPEVRRGSEIAREAQCRIGCDSTLAIDDPRNAIRGHFQCLRERIRRQAKFVQKLVLQNLAWVNGRSLAHVRSSMIVHDLDLIGISTAPHKTDAVLLVDPDAVLPSAVTAQLFKPVSRRGSQVDQVSSRVQHQQFPVRPSYDVPRHEVGALALEYRSRPLTSPRLDCHAGIMPCVYRYVKRTYSPRTTSTGLNR